jgi:hypothetical protein
VCAVIPRYFQAAERVYGNAPSRNTLRLGERASSPSVKRRAPSGGIMLVRMLARLEGVRDEVRVTWKLA